MRAKVTMTFREGAVLHIIAADGFENKLLADNDQEIIDLNFSNIPAAPSGWRDVREVFGLLDTATIIFRTVADNNRYHNLKDLLLPDPPEGVQR
jgi:hypothetical protein